MAQQPVPSDHPAPPRGSYRNGRRTRAQLVEAAARIFAAHGYAGGSLRQIATEVGVSHAALLRHFGTKEKLLTAVLEEWGEATERLTGADLAGMGFFEALPRLMEYHVAHRGLIELFLTMATEASSDTHPAQGFMRARYRGVLERVRTHLLEAQASGQVAPMTEQQVDVEVRALCAVMDGLELQWLLDPGTDLVATFTAHLESTLSRWRRGTEGATGR